MGASWRSIARMRAMLAAALGFLCIPSPTVFVAQSAVPAGPSPYVLKWQTPGIGYPAHVGRYTFTVVEDPDAQWETRLHVFLQGPGDSKPRLFYSYGRDFAVAVVPGCHLAVVDDTMTTKLSKSVAVSLPDLKQTNLSDDAVAQYSRTYHATPTMFINGFAEAVSRDCKHVLVKVELTYGDAKTSEEAEAEGKHFPNLTYEVSPVTGKVLGFLPAGQPTLP